MVRLLAGIFTLFIIASTAMAQSTTQNGVWIQIEALETLNEGQARARAYAGRIENVNGYDLGTGWYGIALGPYSRNDAQALLRQLRRDRTIPGDSYIVTGGQFRQQFWPIGAGGATEVQPLPGASGVAGNTGTEPDVEVEIVVEPVVEPEPAPAPDETRREALASEGLLSRDEKKDLQSVLQWSGHYAAAIDGSYGRGTRAAMTTWQTDNGYEPTGVLTTLQRAQAYANYNAVLEGMDLAVVYDRQAGIAMQMPTGVVAFSEYSPPFARYRPTGGLDVEVLLISQEGNQDRFFGLYEILQTLDMIPPEGPRERSSNSFTIEGEDARSHTYTFARLADGQIKGFTLIWPAGDEERRGRVLAEMRASFSLAEGVLDPSLAPAGEDQAVDLVSGLEVRKPIRERSGFFIDQNGRAITSAEAVAECREVTLDTEHPAQVVFLDEVLGLAVLEPLTPLAPLGVAAFQPAVPRIGNRVAVAGYPFGGVLAAPALTFGQLADIRGLNGEDTIKRLDLAALPGDFGGPVMDDSGALLGMMLARATDGPVLPGDVSFIADAEAVIATLQTAGIAVDIASGSTPISSAALTRHASDITVLVSCWN